LATEIVAKEDRSIIKILYRALLLRCPACGESSIVQKPFHVKHHCAVCKVLFKREDGFFVGAILANVMATEVVILAVYLISMPVLGIDYQIVLTILFILALVFPLAFFHHSWSLWLGLDHLVESLPKMAEKRP
jgi:uncharacterized protein (DUF983 family)